MSQPRSDAPFAVACVALVAAVLGHVAGWGSVVGGLAGKVGSKTGVWMLGGAGLALAFNGLAIGLGVTALLLRAGRRAPYALPIAVIAIALGVVGMLGVAVLGALGLLVLTPGVQ